jgi:DtxR family manganese transport transcriptional regulator
MTSGTQTPNSARDAAKRRADHANENTEDYVELIGDIQRDHGAAHVTDIARALGVSHVTVHKMVKRLKALGLVRAEPYRAVTLTEAGITLATESRERHALTLRFLAALGVPDGPARQDAEGIEHHLGPELIAQMQLFCDLMEAKGRVLQAELQGPSAG